MSLCEASSDDDTSGFLGTSATIRKARDSEGRIGAERKKTAPEMRRTKAVGGGKTEPISPYKKRKDIGTQRQVSTRVQQPEQERGSVDVKAKAAAAAKEERKKAALARIAAKKAGGAAPAEKPKAKEPTKTASQLLAKKKKETVSPDYKPAKASGMTRAERDKARNQAKGEMLKQRKAKLFADYKEVHGKNPTGKERTRLLGLAHQSMKG